ncbi:MAG: type II secretion system protein [Phormidium sp. GEM2.Bin31]|nr:MAG: type II secretion system protein [Phormidium sp. GEM2.Bin31]
MTLIEGLVAILIVSAVGTAITPMMFLSVATRVQNRRAEQAVQLAHGQIDQVRVLIEQGINDEDDVRELPYHVEGATSVREVGPPTQVFNQLLSTNFECSQLSAIDLATVTADRAFPVDINGNCEADFFVQTYRTNQVVARRDGEDIPVVFAMGVRVYYRNADFGNLETDEASLVMTTGEGQQTTRPLAALYTVMAQGDTRVSLDRYHCFLGSNVPGCD